MKRKLTMQKGLKYALVLVTILGCSLFSGAQNLGAENFEIAKIDSVLEEGIMKMAFPGAVLWVQHRDSVLIHKAYGYHTYDSMVKVERNHLYDLASVTKVTAATLAVMKLYEDGLIKLDKPISKYLTFLKGNKRGKSTFRELLAHQAGWRPWIPYHQEIRDKNGRLKKKWVAQQPSDRYDFKLTEDKYLRSDFYDKIKRFIKKAELSDEKVYRYSGLFFYLVPELVQQLTGQSLDVYLNEHFYESMGAKTLGFNPLERFPLSQIVPTEVDTFFREVPIHGYVHDEGAIMMRGVSGNAGLFSNAADVGKVWSMFLNRGTYGSEVYLKQQTVDLFTTVQYPNNQNRRGLGFDMPTLSNESDRSNVSEWASPRSYGHSGYTGPLVWADPDHDLVFVFLCNRVYPTRNQRMIYELAIRPTIQSIVYEMIKNH
ncbi:MAG: serine hydrolase [Cytophagales bacterium]|nr:serine hydrolase [Cytophagales bacterium]